MLTKEQIVRFTLFLAVVNFFIAAFLGLIIRLFPFVNFGGISVRDIIHGHSHVAFLGWVFIALIGLIYKNWFSGCKRVIRRYLIFLTVAQLSVFGMLVTFPFTGYALWSIVFSTIHMLASFYFIYLFKKKSLPGNEIAKPFIYWALAFMALSSLGPLALGPISVMGEKFGMWYNLSIYFYLHFQYNGWFTLAIIGLILTQFDPIEISLYKGKIKLALRLMVAGVLLTYLLSVLSYKPHFSIYLVGGIGAILQLWGAILLWPLFKLLLMNVGRSLTKILFLIYLAFYSKLVIQLFSSIPFFAELTYYDRDMIVAYLHWVLLGFVSLYLIWAIIRNFWAKLPSLLAKWSVYFFIIGLVLMELLLVLKFYGQSLFEMEVSLLLVSAVILFVSIFTLLVALLKVLRVN